jgi:hypothetical protein
MLHSIGSGVYVRGREAVSLTLNQSLFETAINHRLQRQMPVQKVRNAFYERAKHEATHEVHQLFRLAQSKQARRKTIKRRTNERTRVMGTRGL